MAESEKEKTRRLLFEYRKKFGEPFPITVILGEDELGDVLEKCLKEGKPYEIEYIEDADY